MSIVKPPLSPVKLYVPELAKLLLEFGTDEHCVSTVSKIPSLSSSKSISSFTPSPSVSGLGKGWLATSMFSK